MRSKKKAPSSKVASTDLMEQNQHLNREQLLETFAALSYPLENIVSDVTLTDGVTGNEIPGVEIFTSKALNQAIQNVVNKEGDKNNRLVLLRVGAESRSFVPNEGENNHYVALHFAQDGSNLKLTYIDPTGVAISPQLQEILNSNPSLAGYRIISSQTSLQFTNPTPEGVAPYQMRGNDYDCGVLVALTADMVRNNYEGNDRVSLNEASSRQLGQTLRQLTSGEKTIAEVRSAIGTILNEGKSDDSLDVSAQLKASFKKNSDGTESLELTGRASADISVIKDGKKKSVQGDHVITHALPKHVILKEFQNLKLDEIEDLSVYLRDRRGELYNFISAVAVLDVERKGQLYGALNQALDDYNERRFKIKEIKKLEEYVREHIPSEKQQFFFDNFEQERGSNGRTMIDSVGRIAEAVMTFYNKTPLTAFLQIAGFEDASGSGGKVNSVLEFLDNLDASKDRFSATYLEDERKLVSSAQAKPNATSSRSSARVSQANDAALEQAQKALAQKEQGLNQAFLRESMRQLSGLVFYPEITSEEALKTHREQSGNKDRVRDNSQENLEAVIAKYIHILSAVYPELPEKLFNLSEAGRTFDETGGSNKKDAALNFVTQEFTKHLITSSHQSRKGESFNWPAFANEDKIQEIGDNAVNLVRHCKALQGEHSYEKTDGYRSRASSGAMESIKERILTPVVEFIRENFRLKDKRFEGLVKQLNELDLTGKTDEEFKNKVFQKTSDYCKKDRVDDEKLKELSDLILPSQSKKMGEGR